MSLDKFQSWLNFFQTLEGPKNIDALIIAVLISAVIFFAYIAIKNIKSVLGELTNLLNTLLSIWLNPY